MPERLPDYVKKNLRAPYGTDDHDHDNMTIGRSKPNASCAKAGNYLIQLTTEEFRVLTVDDNKITSDTAMEFWVNVAHNDARDAFDPRILVRKDPDTGKIQWLAAACCSRGIVIATTKPSATGECGLEQWTHRGVIIPKNIKGHEYDKSDFTMAGFDSNGVYISQHVELAGEEGRFPLIIYIPVGDVFCETAPTLARVKVFGPFAADKNKPDNEYYGYWLHPVSSVEKTDTSTLIGYDITPGGFYRDKLTWIKIGGFKGNDPQIITHDTIPVKGFWDSVNLGRGINQPAEKSGGNVRPFYGFVSAPYKIGNTIWLVHTVAQKDDVKEIHSSRTMLRWYRLSWPAMKLLNSGEIRDDTGDLEYGYFNASIGSIGLHDGILHTVIACCRSSEYGSADPTKDRCTNISTFACHLIEDPETNESKYLPIPLQTGRVGDCYPNQLGWGDYSTVCRDADSPKSLWMINHYAQTGGAAQEGKWAINIANLDFSPP